ncbi:MAG: hypothetical protein P1V97_32720 [Planctomycetota bacterium]|nr:hypothetical protein [Planctomycetota bacterium]
MNASLPEETRIAEILVHAKVITIDQLKKAVEFRDNIGAGQIRELVVKLGYAKEAEVAAAIAAKDQQEKPPAPPAAPPPPAPVSINPSMIDYEAMKKVPIKVFEVNNVVILKSGSGPLKLAMADPNNLSAIEEIQFLTDRSVEPVVAPEAAIRKVLQDYERHVEEAANAPEPSLDEEQTDEHPFVALPTDVLLRAFILAMVDRGHTSVEEIMAHAAKIEKG